MFNSQERLFVPTSSDYCKAVLSAPDPTCQQADGPHMTLNWAPASGDLLTYQIYRDGAYIGDASGTSFDDNQNRSPGLEGTKNYNTPGYVIKTRWQDGTTKDSSPVTATALACQPNLTATPGCSNDVAPGGPKVDLSWNNLLGVSEYQIYRKAPNEPNPTLFKILPSSQTSYTDYLVNSLPDNYYQTGDISYYVKAVWPNTEQKDSDIATRSISPCPPFLTVNPSCERDIAPYDPLMSLSWTATQGATSYYIYYDDNQFKTSKLPSEGLFFDDFPCAGLSCTRGYYLKAIAGTDSYYSQTVSKSVDCSIVPMPSAPELAQPSAFCSTNVSKVSLSWTPSNYANYYSIYYVGMPPEGKRDTTQTSLDYQVQGGLDYEFYVRAVGPGGGAASLTQPIHAASCSSPSASTLTISPPACENGEPVINLSWTATTNTERYEIWRGPSASNFDTLVTTIDKFITTFKDTTVSRSITYYYKIVSKGPTGVNPTSSNIPPPVTTDSCYPNTPTLSFSPAPSCESGTGNAIVNLSWAYGDSNTHHYEIYRQDYSETVPIKSEYNISATSWQDKPLSSQTSYNYKIVAVGYGDPPPKIPDPASGYKSATTPNCATPGAFTLNEPSPYCQGAYPRADLSWTSASNATSYDVLRNAISIFNTTAFSYSDWGLGNALSFDGWNNYLAISDTNNILSPDALTFEVWIKILPGWQNNDRIVEKKPYWSADNGWSLEINNSGYMTFLGSGSNYGDRLAMGWTEGVWQYIVITKEAGIGIVNGYLNGAYKDNQQADGIISNTRNLNIASLPAIVDEVRIYNRALTPSEINQHYNGIYNNESGLVGLWHFDEGNGTTASDSSNNGNNGTLVNGPAWFQNGLQWQTNYSWQIKANSPGGSTLSNPNPPSSKQVPVCQPTKPGLVLISFCDAGNKAAVTLRWSYTTNTANYEIYREDKGLIPIATISSAANREWPDDNSGTGLTQGASYKYYVKAIGPGGATESDHINVTTAVCIVPNPPPNVTAGFTCCTDTTGGTCGSGNSYYYPRLNLSWEASANAISYTIYRDPTVNPPFPVTNWTSLSYSDTNVSVNTNYTYSIRAYGAGGGSINTSDYSTTTRYCIPSTPSITSLTPGCDGNTPNISIKWDDATPFNVSKYEIYRSSNTTLPETSTKTITSSMTEFSSRLWKDNVGLAGLMDYYYWVKAVGPAGEKISAVSGPKKTYSCQPPPAPTLGLTNRCTSDSNPITILNWNKTSETTSYQLSKNGAPFKTLTPSSSNYLREWLVLGQFPYTYDDSGTGGTTYQAFNNDFIGGETTVKPRASETAGGKTWTQYTSPSDVVDFYNYFPWPKEYVITYAFAYIYSPINQTVQLRMGSDDGYKVFLNGQLVKSNYVWRGAGPDQDIFSITLTPGINHLLIKVQNGNGGWGFYARITDASGNDILNNMTSWDSSAATGVGVNYSVTATGPGGTSLSSNPVSSIPLSCLPATPILEIEAGCSGNVSQLRLNWSPDDNNNTFYWSIYKRRADQPLPDPPITVYAPETTYPDPDILVGDEYFYYLTPYGFSGTPGNSSYEESGTATACTEEPTKPIIQDVKPTCSGINSKMLIIWNADTSGKTLAFNVWRKKQGESDFSKITDNELSPSTTKYLDAASKGEIYQYEIEAVGSGENNNSRSDPSPEKTAIDCTNIPSLPPYPLWVNPEDIISIANLPISVNLNWAESGNENGYRIYRIDPGMTEPILIIDLDTSGHDHDPSITQNYFDMSTLSGLVDGKTYIYKVVAYNDFDFVGTPSNEETVNIPYARPSPFTLCPNGQVDCYKDNNKIRLIWEHAQTTNGAGLITYQLYRNDKNEIGSTPIPGCSLTCSDTNFPCSGLSNPIECFDQNPDPTQTWYFVKATAANPTDGSNIRYSNIFQVGIPIPKWKELIPWF